MKLKLAEEDNALAILKLKDDNEIERKKKLQKLEFQKAEYESIKEKMKDPMFVANLRQSAIFKTYTDL